MKMLLIELKKEKRTGIPFIMPLVGVFGTIYVIMNYMLREDTLLHLPLPPMDILLTQMYGILVLLNMFGIILASCMICQMEFQGNAIKKLIYCRYRYQQFIYASFLYSFLPFLFVLYWKIPYFIL